MLLIGFIERDLFAPGVGAGRSTYSGASVRPV
jgi:hypothetical protein